MRNCRRRRADQCLRVCSSAKSKAYRTLPLGFGARLEYLLAMQGSHVLQMELLEVVLEVDLSLQDDQFRLELDELRIDLVRRKRRERLVG